MKINKFKTKNDRYSKPVFDEKKGLVPKVIPDDWEEYLNHREDLTERINEVIDDMIAKIARGPKPRRDMGHGQAAETQRQYEIRCRAFYAHSKAFLKYALRFSPRRYSVDVEKLCPILV